MPMQFWPDWIDQSDSPLNLEISTYGLAGSGVSIQPLVESRRRLTKHLSSRY